MMKKTLILSMLSLLTTSMRAADYSYLVFTMSDGSTKSVSASNLNITFSGSNLIATDGSNTVTIDVSTLTKMEFSNEESTGITAIENSQLSLDNAEIYDLNGRRMASYSSLPKGVYIIKSNGKTTKIQVR